MKIAFLLDTFPSVTETFIARDIDALRRHGLEIEVFALHAGAGARPLAPPRSVSLQARRALEKLTGPGERAGYFKALGAAWWQQLSGGGAANSIGHIHAGWASHPACIAWGAAERANTSWSFSGHARDIYVAGGDLPGKLAAARFATVCTRAALRHLEETAPGQSAKVFYSPHGIEAKNIEFAAWNVPPVPQILAVGRLVEKKGFGVLLDACAILRSRNVPFSVRIIGEGPLRKTLRQRRDRLNLRETVAFAGAVAPAEVLAAMRTATCLAVPALTAADGDRDGLPNVILEAAACGLPLVATRAGAIDEFVDDSTGVLCAPGRAEELADAIAEVIAHRDRTEERRHAARRRVVADFDLMANAHRLAGALRAALGGRSASD